MRHCDIEATGIGNRRDWDGGVILAAFYKTLQYWLAYLSDWTDWFIHIDYDIEK